MKSKLGAWVVGESVSVNGVCLTVNEALPDGFLADVSAETLARSTLGRLAVGSAVNLERALQIGERMGGHWVTGHVDTVVRWISSKKTGESLSAVLELPQAFVPYVAPKGSVAVEGVSLTVNEVEPRSLHRNDYPAYATGNDTGADQAGRWRQSRGGHPGALRRARVAAFRSSR